MTQIGNRDVPQSAKSVNAVSIWLLIFYAHQFTIEILWEIRGIQIAQIDEPID